MQRARVMRGPGAAHAGRLRAVVAQEDLLEVVVAGADRADLVRGGRLDHGVGRALEGDGQRAARRRSRRARRAAPELAPAAGARRTRSPAAAPRCAQVLQRVDHDEASLAQDGQPVGDALHLGEGVRGEEHRAALRAHLAPAGRGSSAAPAGPGPAIGSSRISSSGSCMNAWMRPSFWRLPVESSRIGRSRSASKRSASASRTPAVDAATQLGQVVEHRPAGELGIQGEIPREVPDASTDRQAVGVSCRGRAARPTPRSGG